MQNTGRYGGADQQGAAMETGLTCGADRGAIPKMLLPFEGKTLLQHTIDEIKKVDGTELLVVTGCYHLLLKEILEQQQIDFIENDNWKDGMGCSIQKGIAYVSAQYPNANSVIILVCDQPYISTALLEELMITKQQTNKGIVAAAYNDTTGTPVLFDKKYFAALALLRGQYGAKKLIQQFSNDVATVVFPDGAVDIDTMDDYEKLIT
jgi:molybdenum cofactor cytidylyltransferase